MKKYREPRGFYGKARRKGQAQGLRKQANHAICIFHEMKYNAIELHELPDKHKKDT